MLIRDLYFTSGAHFCTPVKQLWRELKALSSICTWTLNTVCLARKVQQGFHFLLRLKRVKLPFPILSTFNKETVELHILQP